MVYNKIDDTSHNYIQVIKLLYIFTLCSLIAFKTANMKTLFTVLLSIAFFTTIAQPGQVKTIAGIGEYPSSGCTMTAGNALFTTMGISSFQEIIPDKHGNLYISACDLVYKLRPNGFISVYAGNGTSGFGGDGGPATAASLYMPGAMTFDRHGNLYICDGANQRIRKVDTLGTITTIAGNGSTGTPGGDGGPATDATLLNVYGITIDTSGNFYFISTDQVKKIDTAGIMTTIAGVGMTFFSSGEGIPATDASFHLLVGVAADRFGNIYTSEYEGSVIRKITPDGIIHNYAGGVAGCGDNVPALSVNTGSYIGNIKVDSAGSVYFIDVSDYVIRKVSTSGIISTVAASLGFSFCSGLTPRVVDITYLPSGFGIDESGNLYVGTDRDIEKVTFDPIACVDSFCVFVNDQCGGPRFTISANSNLTTLSEKTYFGDGQTDSFVLFYSSQYRYWYFTHNYSTPGTYTIKHIFYNSGIPIDSVSYSYTYNLCKTINLRTYFDQNSNCTFDSSENSNLHPLQVIVDSNGITIDSFYMSSGADYNAKGNAGDIYSFRLHHLPATMYLGCPTTGIIYDTLGFLPYSPSIKYFALNCTSPASSFDLEEHVSSNAGSTGQNINILTANSRCESVDGLLTVHFSPKYAFNYAFPTPDIISGTTLKWNLPAFLPYQQKFIQIFLRNSGSVLMPGDTVQSILELTPIAGDADISNNYIERIDTVRLGYDPNCKMVNPSGYISAGTLLHYSIDFENTGNAPAKNIFVMDTLSRHLDINSLKLIGATHPMNISIIKDTTNNIVKFDFPNINLLDSSHHGQCTGMIFFDVKTKEDLIDGTQIKNWAGIFFDFNPVVTTDTVINTIGYPIVSISDLGQQLVSVFPNPSNNIIIVQGNTDMYSIYTINAINGKEVLHGSLKWRDSEINISKLPEGVYYIKLQGSHGTYIHKIIKM